MVFKNHFNYVLTKGELSTKPSLTIQNQTVSIAEMLKRIQGGILPDGSTLTYPDNENDVQIRTRDLSDLDLLQDELSGIYQRRMAQKEVSPSETKTDVEKTSETQ